MERFDLLTGEITDRPAKTPRKRKSRRPAEREPARFTMTAAKRDCVDCWEDQRVASRRGEPVPSRRAAKVLMQTAERDRHLCHIHALDRGWQGRAANAARERAKHLAAIGRQMTGAKHSPTREGRAATW